MISSHLRMRAIPVVCFQLASKRSISCIVLVFLTFHAARADDQPKDAKVPSAEVETVVVTGSRIGGSRRTSESPVAVVSSDEAKLEGTSRAEDLLNNLPQINAGLNSGALGPTGTATVDLRGFGAFRTLVLMNGRRMNPGDPFNPSADLNSVPTAMIKRVEVLTGGASSIYGSDAVAGVVNFVMDTRFTGMKLDLQGGLYQYSNGNTGLIDLARSSGAKAPSGSAFDGGTYDLSAVYGTNLFDNAGHVTIYAGYHHDQAVTAASRDYSACNLRETATYFECIHDDTTSPALFQDMGGNLLTLDPATGNSFRPYVNARDGYNTAPFQYLQRPDTRYNAGMFAEYRVSDKLQAYAEAQFTNDHTIARYEPAGSALNSFGVNCSNPLLSASEVNALCSQFGLGPADTAQVVIGKRNVEGAPRLDIFDHRSYRAVLGVKGEIDKVWSYDAYGQYGITYADQRIANDVSVSKTGRALDVVSVGGVPTCQSVVDGSDPNCVPYNIFSVGAVTTAAVNYIGEGGSQHGNANQSVVSGALTGDLGEYGIKSPFATSGVGLVGGAEYRTESIKNNLDAAFVSGDFAVTSSQSPVAGSYNVYELFSEVNVPLVQDRPFARKLTLALSDRYAQYSLQGPANAYKFGLSWAPVDAVMFRSSISQAIRAPNGHELFTANTISKFQASDPCAGAAPSASLAACEKSGLQASQYGKLPDTGNFNFLSGGNIHLKPETANTYTLGAVFTPQELIPKFVLSVDYWKIKVNTYVGQYAPNATLNSCIGTGDPLFCSLVQRDANGSLSEGSGLTSGRVVATSLNTGTFSGSGIDIDANYALDLDQISLKNAGSLLFHFSGSVAIDNPIQPIPGGQTFDCTGLFGPTCTGEGPTSPIPGWRHQLRLTWSAPEYMEVSVNWRHISHLDSELGSSNPHLAGTLFPVDSRINAYDYIDLETNVEIDSHYSFRLGVNNVFGRKPPVIGSNANPQILPGNLSAAMYDPLGRFLFMGVTLKY